MLHVRLGCEDGLGIIGSKSRIPKSKASLQTLGKSRREKNETKFVLLVAMPIIVAFKWIQLEGNRSSRIQNQSISYNVSPRENPCFVNRGGWSFLFLRSLFEFVVPANNTCLQRSSIIFR